MGKKLVVFGRILEVFALNMNVVFACAILYMSRTCI